MIPITICPAKENEEVFFLAGHFLRGHEIFYCALMQKILEKSQSVYVLQDIYGRVAGVFSYDGHAFTPCLKRNVTGVSKALGAFFKQHKVSCMSGKASCVHYCQKLYKNATGFLPRERRELFLMRSEGAAAEPHPAPRSAPEGTKLVHCTAADAEKLMPLQINYANEEVVPHWQQAVPYVERYALDGALKKQHVLALESGGAFVAKAQTNALTPHFWQIGGVYTKKEYRGRGYASFLTGELSRMAAEKNAGTILYVKKQNGAALSAYKKAGFSICGNYSIFYFS